MIARFEDPRAMTADIAFRRRALKVNCGIYSRRHGPRLLPVLADSRALRACYIGQVAWLGAERDWRPEDARRLSELASDIARFGRLRPAIAEVCQWHADRLRELVRQHAALARLEAEHGPAARWPVAASGTGRCCGGSTRTKRRSLPA